MCAYKTCISSRSFSVSLTRCRTSGLLQSNHLSSRSARKASARLRQRASRAEGYAPLPLLRLYYLRRFARPILILPVIPEENEVTTRHVVSVQICSRWRLDVFHVPELAGG